jgi:acetyltransferase-like isoleucine patch superfamily enzyme
MPIISQYCRVRNHEHFSVGTNSIIDDWCYFSTKVKIGEFSHIGPGCVIAGGKKRLFSMGDCSSLSSGVKVYCTSDDFVNDIGTILTEELESIKSCSISGDVILENYNTIGTNSVIMPNNMIPEGTVIGALSYVPPEFDFKPWGVYAGIPIRFIKPRNKKNIMKQVDAIIKSSHSIG